MSAVYLIPYSAAFASLPTAMPLQMRNPFRKAPGDHFADENARPPTARGEEASKGGIYGSVKPLEIRPNGDKQPAEYKLSGTPWFPAFCTCLVEKLCADIGRQRSTIAVSSFRYVRQRLESTVSVEGTGLNCS